LIRAGEVIPEDGFLLQSVPNKSLSKYVNPTTAQSTFPPEFSLAKFNQCVPERRTVLDEKNKTIAVVKIFNIYNSHSIIYNCI